MYSKLTAFTNTAGSKTFQVRFRSCLDMSRLEPVWRSCSVQQLTFRGIKLGYFTWNQEHGRHAFFVPVPYKTLFAKDKRTVNFVISKIHGLSYQPSQTEHAQNPRIVSTLIKDLWWVQRRSRGERCFDTIKNLFAQSRNSGLSEILYIKPPLTIVTQLRFSFRRQHASLSSDRMYRLLALVQKWKLKFVAVISLN